MPPASIMYSQVHSLYSEQVDDTYKIAVWLPPDYETLDATIPCIYVLDEPEFFGFASAIALNYWLREQPQPMMIVSIGKELASLDDWWSIRWRDYCPTVYPKEPLSGGANHFLEFLHDDLIPFIETQYPVDTAQRTLWGHSLSGLFAIYALIQYPALFRHIIATSPAFVADETELFPYHLGLPSPATNTPQSLFLSVGDAEPDFKPSVDVFADVVQQQAHPNLTLDYHILNGMPHMPAALTGFLRGMQTIYP